MVAPRNGRSSTNITATSAMFADPTLIAVDNDATESMRTADALAALVTLIERSRPRWHSEAACRQHPEVNFHSRGAKQRAAAFTICGGCPVRDRCLDWAARRQARKTAQRAAQQQDDDEGERLVSRHDRHRKPRPTRQLRRLAAIARDHRARTARAHPSPRREPASRTSTHSVPSGQRGGGGVATYQPAITRDTPQFAFFCERVSQPLHVQQTPRSAVERDADSGVSVPHDPVTKNTHPPPRAIGGRRRPVFRHQAHLVRVAHPPPPRRGISFDR